MFGLFAYLLCVLSSHAFPAPIVQSSILGRTYGLRMTGHSARCPRCERRWLDLPRIRPRGEHLGRSLAKNRDSGRRHGVRGRFYIGTGLVVNCELAVMSPPRCLILSSPTGISGNGPIGGAGGIGGLRVHKACYRIRHQGSNMVHCSTENLPDVVHWARSQRNQHVGQQSEPSNKMIYGIADISAFSSAES